MARYTPWGEALDTFGTGIFTFGYFGGIMDAATGLHYVGNGQHYDPAIGRFLTRDAKPNNSNPYVPWDPTGAIIGPLGIAALFFSKRKKASKAGTLLILFWVAIAVSVTLVACGGPLPEGQVTATIVSTPGVPVATATAIFVDGTTITGTIPSPGGTPTEALAVPCQTIETPSPTQTPTPTPPLLTGSALIAYNTYAALRDHAGWWNNHIIGSITPLDFLEIMISYEFSGDVVNEINPEILKETVVRNFYVRCEAFTGHPCSPHSATDIFIYIGEKCMLDCRPGYILQAGDDPNGNVHWNPENQTRSKLDFSEAIRSPQPRWTMAFVDQPIEWGNLSMMLPTLRGKVLSAPEGIATNQVFLRRGTQGTGDPMFILTECQTNHWSQYGQDEDYGVRVCGEEPGWTSRNR